MAFVAPLIGAVVGGIPPTAVGQAVIGVALSIGASYLAKRLQPKAGSSGTQGASLNLRLESNESREIAFGRCASAGSLKYHNSYGPNGNDYIQLVFVLADHECDALEQFYVDGKLVTLSGSTVGGPANGTNVVEFPNVMWIDFKSGAWTQPADADLDAQNGNFTSNDRGRGVCYVRVTLKFDEKLYANGLPKFLFVFRGAKLYDWRKDSTNGGSGAHRFGTESTYEWTDNPAVILYNYRRGIFTNSIRLGGMSTPATSLPVANWTAAANVCDELVSLKAGGNEKRYRMGGIVPVLSEHAAVVRDIVTATGGVEIDSGGIFVFIPGAAQASSMTIADTDLMANEDAVITPKLSRATLINAVFGTFQDPAQQYEEVGLPPRISPADEASDGGVQLSENFALNFVQSGTQGQRITEILRRKVRFQRRVNCRLRARFSLLESGDWVTWTSARYGWTGMLFEVLQATRNADMTVDVELREIATSVFAWNALVDELDPTNPVAVGAGGSTLTTVAGIALTPTLVVGVGGTQRPGLTITWTAITDLTVVDLKLEFRKVGDLVALDKLIMDPASGSYTWVDGVQGGVTYEARLTPIVAPERPVTPSAYVPMVSPTGDQVVSVAQFTNSVSPDSVTPAMLSPQARFELALITAVDSVLGSAAQKANDAMQQAHEAAVSALQGLTEAQNARFRVIDLTEPFGEMGAQWGVAIVEDAGIPRVLGLVKLDGSESGSEFSIVADRLSVAQPGITGGAPIPVFTIANVAGVPKIAFRGDMYADGSITAQKISVGTLDALTGNFGTMTAGELRSTNLTTLILNLNAGTFEINS